MNITTHSIVGIEVGRTLHVGYLEKITQNHLGQTCYIVDGQYYSDPYIYHKLGVGQVVRIREWNETNQNFKLNPARITDIKPIQQTGKFHISAQFWVGELQKWSDPVEVNYNDLSASSLQEPIPNDRTLVLQSNTTNHSFGFDH